MDTFTSETVSTIWWGSLAIFAVVIIVVALLLTLIVRCAERILQGASAIWTQGQLVANNTIQIPILFGLTARTLQRIRQAAVDVVGATERIQAHAEACPRCPDCATRGELP